MNSYDIDGVIYMGEHRKGLVPGTDDIIITGRSYEQKEATLAMLRARGIYNMVFFNPLERKDSRYGRSASGLHKAKVLDHLRQIGSKVDIHFEDDPIQARAIRTHLTETEVIMIGDGVFNA